MNKEDKNIEITVKDMQKPVENRREIIVFYTRGAKQMDRSEFL